MQSIVVAGAARCLWEDLSQVSAALPIIAVNFAGLFIPRVAHLASLHPEALGHVAALRRLLPDTNHQFTTHAHRVAVGIDRVWPEGLQGGSSSLFAAYVALELGYDRVLLAGVPLDSTGSFYDGPAAPYYSFSEASVQDAWAAALPYFAGRVRSCSGWTRALLGEPR